MGDNILIVSFASLFYIVWELDKVELIDPAWADEVNISICNVALLENRLLQECSLALHRYVELHSKVLGRSLLCGYCRCSSGSDVFDRAALVFSTKLASDIRRMGSGSPRSMDDRSLSVHRTTPHAGVRIWVPHRKVLISDPAEIYLETFYLPLPYNSETQRDRRLDHYFGRLRSTRKRLKVDLTVKG
ncbi:unnamed protein product [Hymenolepis diminuta]|uniref:Secreted protein n=1 Tax=Hymenolepis diminuta TaxID=6216 RepID=A0A0R3SGU9_HYMDI|nr:unnamed protein product [Hymenolepis diminuta]